MSVGCVRLSTSSKRGFTARNAAEDKDSGQAMQSESTRCLACTVEARDDLVVGIDHLVLLVYFEAGERIVEYWRRPCSVKRRFLDLSSPS